MRNNQFLHNRARGALLQTAYGLVEGNTFVGQTLYALYLPMFPPEGPGAQNVVIAHNKVSQTGITGGPGAIDRSSSTQSARAPEHHFQRNVVSEVPGPAFYISSAKNVVLSGNTLRNTNTRPLENRWNSAGDLNSPILINDASNIVLLHNWIPGKPLVRIDPGTTAGIRAAN